MLHGSIFGQILQTHRDGFCTSPFLLPFVFASMHVASALAQSPPLDPSQGDGRVSAFYQWTEPVVGKPGQLLDSEPLPKRARSLASRHSEAHPLHIDGPALEVGHRGRSARDPLIWLLRMRLPPGGWPLVAWAHGTLGVADICAPSWAGHKPRDAILHPSGWLWENGFAVVATDYQGLGVPGAAPLSHVGSRGALGARRPARVGARDLSADNQGSAHKVLHQRPVAGGRRRVRNCRFCAKLRAGAEYPRHCRNRRAVSFGKDTSKPSSKDPNKVDPTLAYILYISD